MMTSRGHFHLSDHPTLPETRPLTEQVIAYETLPGPVAKAFETFGFKTWHDVAECNGATLLMFKGFGRVHYNYVRDEVNRRAGHPQHQDRPAILPPPHRARVLRLSDMPVRSGVYFLKCAKLVKIGSAKDVRSRFRTIWRMNPFPLELLGIIEPDGIRTLRQIEAEHHRRFREYREFGEWFRYEGDLADYCFTLGHAVRERDMRF